jgi:hypothetical protein
MDLKVKRKVDPVLKRFSSQRQSFGDEADRLDKDEATDSDADPEEHPALHDDESLSAETTAQATRILIESDAIVIMAGAGMSVDSGLPDYRFSLHQSRLILSGVEIVGQHRSLLWKKLE